ncbi:type II toxin-antitoxin system RelE/ParE family toxin [Streptomyces gamaensis]|uniref:Type II toxin-antitoxin system RelE/ParE family toxin n=1 Tax=Streptomyces gamaensis TaxID=1763542 RepID=A0ABW0YY72_9ACTN
MRFTLIWANNTARKLRELRQRDGEQAVKPLADAINDLARDPRPTGATRMGGTENYRLRVGPYRALYGVDGRNVAVTMLMIGSTPSR